MASVCVTLKATRQCLTDMHHGPRIGLNSSFVTRHDTCDSQLLVSDILPGVILAASIFYASSEQAAISGPSPRHMHCRAEVDNMTTQDGKYEHGSRETRGDQKGLGAPMQTLLRPCVRLAEDRVAFVPQLLPWPSCVWDLLDAACIAHHQQSWPARTC